ncbi:MULTISPECIES: S-methyl-5-thioribose-1-phosphate isomerase [unclassified Halanaerobium]|uniref:S-methyl-5-thioribose-1-phosphate isomerase n=1 Tax=unclassified Halanaerobium TaxID=2641197 RepID=UPI000E18BFDB|nr:MULTISPECIES: S-methyl-5-thioribose-1-phosphate isomerase [unclassified Halanaerobium]RCW51553.1 methylthioribose-1-phosphate isomerase [Halanaerobium sp. MA284_MarDTE_T2]RCW89341.1 methylthioribose-1-phosphate isomerase [Halanaerobium sp. DL-01]
MRYKTIEFKENKLILLDQRKLPTEVKFFECSNYKDVEFAISNMVVRGAPAIGAAAAYGYYLAAEEFSNLDKNNFKKELKKAADFLVDARPTAVNLSWAVNIMYQLTEENDDRNVEDIVDLLYKKACQIAEEDIKINKQMAEVGNKIIPEGAVILTHCNTGALATVDYGTALGVIREAHFSGKNIKVFADETRPRLQGARLTAFELVEEGIPSTLIADSVAATLIRDGKIDVILTGADRVAANGDSANKIGTYMLSEIANKFDVPFYIAAPLSTIDRDINSGDEIEIEERPDREVTHIEDVQIAPAGINIYNPAFDVTPAENISGIITEKGIARKPFKESINSLFKK